MALQRPATLSFGGCFEAERAAIEMRIAEVPAASTEADDQADAAAA